MNRILHSICLSLVLMPVLVSGRPTIGVSDFGTQYGRTLHRVVPNIITENLINSGQFDFYEREKLGTLLQEQGFQSSGMVDPATAVTLGRLSGIDYILTGEIVDFGREVRNFSGYGVRTTTVDYRLEVAVRVIETETGRVVFSKTEMAEERQNQGSTRVLDTTMDARLGRIVGDQLSQALLNSPVFAAPEEKPAPESAVIHITSEPANASVEIDGVFYGNAGGSFELPAGLHQIRISLPGYAVWDKKVMVRDGASFHVPLVRTSDIRVEVEENTSISTSQQP
ncbi:MAG: CsgG/HfaB family protein [Puniceicoccaceae bacterium]